MKNGIQHTPVEAIRLERNLHDADATFRNPLLLDDRDDNGEELIERGVRLYRYLAQCANAGASIGVGYAQFVCCVHGS